ncbi:MAG: hypothetical protein Q8P18_31090 [Pseudomonadota bacterium]|nr:hypothetical protein [Pseudomonadota bacterium]
MIPLSLALAGCHVFDVVEIVCASDEACAEPPADADTDTDADTDADTDTDTDTDIVAPTSGWVISGANSSGSRVLVFNALGVQVAAWTELGDAAGPVAFDPAIGAAFLAADDALYRLSADGALKVARAEYPGVLDIAFADGFVYAATGDGVVTWNASDDTAEVAAFDAPVSGLVGVGRAPGASIYATDTDGGSPDLYQWSVGGGAPVVLHTDFDVSAARATIVFAGPDDQPYTCSAAGAFYSVADLAAGGSRHVAYYEGGLTDVSACAFDRGDGTWLLFSPSAGVIRLDMQSRAKVVLEPSSSYDLIRGGFY